MTAISSTGNFFRLFAPLRNHMILLLLNQCLNGCKNGMYSEYIVKQYTLGCDGNVKIVLECQFYGVSFVFYPSTPQPWSQVWILKIHFIACIGWSHIFWCVFSILFHNIRGQTRKYLGKGTREGRQREHQPDVRQPLEIFKIPSPFACGSRVVWHVSPLNIWSLTAVKANCCAKG